MEEEQHGEAMQVLVPVDGLASTTQFDTNNIIINITMDLDLSKLPIYQKLADYVMANWEKMEVTELEAGLEDVNQILKLVLFTCLQ